MNDISKTFKIMWTRQTENGTLVGYDEVVAALSIHAVTDWMDPELGYQNVDDRKSLACVVEPEVIWTKENGGQEKDWEIQFTADDGEGHPVVLARTVSGYSTRDALVNFILQDETTETVLVTGVVEAESRPKHQWINIFEVAQNYGGPEEGGWYYDSGEVLASIPILPTDDRPIGDRLKVWEEWATETTGLPTRWTYRTGYRRIEVKVENHAARAYPDQVPHYE